ncbi:hypothetical protein [Spiroplasma endosymbiont of Virgichneumon dumeticola]|uniref:hypothetical protein n=1 Tax=Spiroplasma endosymbiont of Virgichneumon dumeticola TaxID=3139323 RepID=UPI0035C8AC6E
MNIYGIYAQKKDSKKISKNIIKSDDFIRILKANIILHIKITKLASYYLDKNKAIETINRTFFLAKFMKIKDIENKLEKLIKLKTKLSNYISKYNDLIREDWIKKTEEKIIILQENTTDNNLNGNIKNIFLMFEKCKENMDKLKKILSEHNNFIGECNTIKIPKVYQTIFEQTYNALAAVYPEYYVPSNSSAPNTLASIIKGIFEKMIQIFLKSNLIIKNLSYLQEEHWNLILILDLTKNNILFLLENQILLLKQLLKLMTMTPQT